MNNFEFLTDAQSEQVAGGLYLGTSVNTVTFNPTLLISAVAGSASPALMGHGGGNVEIEAEQTNHLDVFNTLLSLF